MTIKCRFSALLLAAVAVAACGGSPTSPPPGSGTATPSSTTYAGAWLVDIVIESCSGNRQCVHSLGDTRQFLLRLVGEDGGLSGVFNIDRLLTTEVKGHVDAAGDLMLSGFTPAAFPGVVGSTTMEVTKLQGRFVPGLASSGSVEYAMRGVPQGDFFGNYVVRGRITRAVRLADGVLTGNSFTGTWRGQVAIRSCSFTGWVDCWPMEGEEMHYIELRLAQAAGDVTGTMTLGSSTIDVTGTASGATLVLRGSKERVVSGGRDVETILEWTSTRDAVGLMRGVFRYKDQYLMDDGRENQTTYEAVELWSVILR